MTREESITIVAMIANSWPGAAWEAERLDAYAQALIGYDAALTTRAVALAVKELKYRPSVAELREFIHIERALSAPVSQHEQPARPGRLPRWVTGWLISRVQYKDFRVWAEQDPLGHSGDLMPSEDRDKYMLEGEGLSLGDMLRAIGVAA